MMSIKIMVFWHVMQLEDCNAKTDMAICFSFSWLVQKKHYAILKFKKYGLHHKYCYASQSHFYGEKWLTNFTKIPVWQWTAI